MEEMIPTTQFELFNGRLETGVRAIIILDAVYPKSFDLTHLTWLDYLVVHTEDVEGPSSLHPNIPQRIGELIVRRRLIEDSLKLMTRLHLIEIKNTDAGILYCASDEASGFVENLRSTYSRSLRERAIWLSHYLSKIDERELEGMINEKIGRWSIEFQDTYKPGNMKDGL